VNTILGIPIGGLTVALLLVLAVCTLAVLWVAWRRPVIFKLGVRNIPRRKAQTVLIVAGLMLSTLIISAALGTGDTINHSMTADIYDNLGQVDQIVVASHDGEAESDLTGGAPLDGAALALVDAAVAGNPDVDGVLPMLETRAPVVNDTRQLAEPDIVVTGLDAARIDRFGGLRAVDGSPIDLAALARDEVVVSAKLAGDIDAAAGDRLTIFIADVPHVVTVATVSEDSYLAGTRRARGTDLEHAGLTMPLAQLQSFLGQPDTITSVAVSNRGAERDALELSDTVTAGLRQSLAGSGLGVDPIKQVRVDHGEETANTFTTVFVILGLFSVTSGVLLIVLIFTMLASERRPEMGMARAIGAQRRQLMQQFVSEGAGYALAAGLAGALLGVATTYGIAIGLKAIFGEYAPIEAHVEPRSMLLAYALGVVITFLTVAAASWKISRINIVAAVRDIADVASPARKLSTLIWAVVLLAVGGLLALSGSGSGDQMTFTTGMSLLPFGLALLLRFFGAPGRPVFTAVGLAILAFWLMPESQFESLFGSYEGGIAVFFTSGIFMVIGATILIVQYFDLLLKAVTALGGLFRSTLPAARTAVAYPGAARGRTGLTIAMFSLIVFSLVMMATMNETSIAQALGDEANAGWDVRADARGSAAGLGDVEAALAAQGVDTTRFAAVGTLTNPSEFHSEVRQAGTEDQAWKKYPVYGMDARFIEHSELTFDQRAEGYATDAEILAALAAEPNVAVVDSWAIATSGDIGGNDDLLILEGLSADDEVFTPQQVELVDPRSGRSHVVTVIGVIGQQIGSLYGIYTNQATVDAVYGDTATTSTFVALNDPAEAGAVAKEIESALLSAGVQGTSIRDELRDAQRQSSGFLYIIEGFMGLGLFVGVAAIGVIAFRSVVERRQQIGVLRALGWQRELVSLSFMIETAFVVGIGMLTGTGLGLQLASKLVASGELGAGDVGFVIPWTVIVVILVATFVVALLMTWIPSRQAGRVAPAEALRYE